MREDRRAARRTQIEEAAYALLAERGLTGTSMLEIAKRARASNETLYRWYGDKQGLMAALVARNAAAARARLLKPLEQGETLRAKLLGFGAVLLCGLLSERAVALNRAAAADPGGALGQVLAAQGRESVTPLLSQLFAEAGWPAESCETYLALLLGDLQIRRAIGTLDEPGTEFCTARAERVNAQFFTLMQAQSRQVGPNAPFPQDPFCCMAPPSET